MSAWKPAFLTAYFFVWAAQAVQIINSNEGIVLRDPSCIVLKGEAEQIEILGELSGKKKFCKEARADQNTCHLDVTTCVPDLIREIQGATAKEKGPNCWNFALVVKGILPGFRYSPPEEMSYYARSPLCEVIKPGQKPSPGDIGLIRARNDQTKLERHGFIYVSENLVLSKNSFAMEDPYALQSLPQMMKKFDIPKAPQCDDPRFLNFEKCTAHVEYFHCKSMHEYLESTKAVPEQLTVALHHMDSFENCYGRQMMDGGILGQASWESLENTVSALTSYLVNERRRSPLSEEGVFVLGALQLRLEGIIGTLNKNKIHDPMDYFNPPAILEEARKLEELQGLLRKASEEI